ncbi:transcriptional regulator CynR [Bradyrhizobium sp. B124]|uniref:transcriptional regulator CynR n=1 Tax=Bradyrhizobium sp. B124 TaxID=3140245 RepID=UPI0031836CBD
MLLRHARYLLAVADKGSFTRAAAELHVSQPALSQQIRQLEETLGAKLLDRSGRVIRPTDAGRVYIDHARRAVREFEAARRAIHDVEGLERGALRVAFTPTFTTYLVGPLTQQFYARHPGVLITINVLAQVEMEAALAADALDLGIAFGDVRSEDVTAEPLYQERLCLIVGEEHPAHGLDVLPAADLRGMDLALLNKSFVTRRAIDRYFHDQEMAPRVAVESDAVDSLLAVVRGGSLATVAPEAAARHGELKAVQLSPPIAERTVSVLLRRDAYRSAATRAFMRLLAEWDWDAMSAP